jgi:hypothetical protein
MSRLPLVALVALALAAGCRPLCTPNGEISENGDGSDCCGGYDSNTNLCGSSTQCTAAGAQSRAGDGSDCCFTSTYVSATNVCGACVPNDQTSAAGDGTDCCTGVAQWNSDTLLCGECIGDGIASVAGDGTDCCSTVGQYDSVTGICGRCVTAGNPSTGTGTAAGSDCCKGESYSSITNDCEG